MIITCATGPWAAEGVGEVEVGAAYHCSGPPAPPQLGITPRICDEEATATAQGDEDALRLLSSMAMRRFLGSFPDGSRVNCWKGSGR